MTHVAIVGCGVVGAAIAYELSRIDGLHVTLCDRQPPAQAATGAALGVLMGAISQKTKGKAWALRHASLTRYHTLIPELEAITQRSLPVNKQGIVMLCFADDRAGDRLDRWDALIALRQQQGWPLERWDRAELAKRCPQVHSPEAIAAIYSPRDFQVDPTVLTLALVEAAVYQGATVRFDAEVSGWQQSMQPNGSPSIALHLNTKKPDTKKPDTKKPATEKPATETLTADWLVIAAGLGSTALTQATAAPLTIQPVLGQAIRLRLPQPLGDPTFQPVISGHDIHVVPVGDRDYWVGATVEFPTDSTRPTTAPAADPALLDAVIKGAIALCPSLANGDIQQTWSGLRPRPYERPAPIIEPLSGYTNVLLATGHYRNGVLLAPATALGIRQWIAPDAALDSAG